MSFDYDYVIIGSGFGGSVSALRLSEKGYKVLVIEKGKWYHAKDFAKTNWNLRKWLWIPSLRCFGIMRLSIFKHLVALSGTGVGGGSLVYGNTLPIPKSQFFKSGDWKELADWEKELQPFYEKALKMMGTVKNPKLFDGDLVLQQIAQEMGIEHQFDTTDVAVFFGEENKPVEDPYFEGKGPKKEGCNFCGKCMTGCRNNAKNSLDKNYLHLAQHHGAEVKAQQEVINIVPLNEQNGSKGYRIEMRSSTPFFKQKQRVTTKGVILSGGVLGTLKLLLKLKNSTLPHLSDMLGDHVRTNNETLISVCSLDKNRDLSKGIAIGSILQTDENSFIEVVRYGKGSGFWKLLHIPFTSGKNPVHRIGKMSLSLVKYIGCYFRIYFVNSWSKETAILLFMQTLDSTLKFKRKRNGTLSTSVTSGERPTPFISESIKLTQEYSKIVKGKPASSLLETIAGIPTTAHLLGGAVMGSDPSTGVIDTSNRVFGYQNMYIIDGSMISSNPGVNPSLSILAMAERAMTFIPEK